MASLGTYIFSGLLGIMSGVVTSIVISRVREPPLDGLTRPKDEERPVHDSEAIGRLSRRVAELESLGTSTASPKSQLSSDSGDEPNTTAPMDPEAYREQTAAHFIERVAAHHAEAVDPSWAPEAAGALRRTLQSIGQQTSGFHVAAVECKTTTCTSTLEWANYMDAVHTYTSIVHSADIPCRKTVLLEEPTDVTTNRYRSTALFDCTNMRPSAD